MSNYDDWKLDDGLDYKKEEHDEYIYDAFKLFNLSLPEEIRGHFVLSDIENENEAQVGILIEQTIPIIGGDTPPNKDDFRDQLSYYLINLAAKVKNSG